MKVLEGVRAHQILRIKYTGNESSAVADVLNAIDLGTEVPVFLRTKVASIFWILLLLQTISRMRKKQ